MLCVPLALTWDRVERGADDRVEAEQLQAFEPVALAAPGCIVAIAARIGGTRLIDNVILGAADGAT